MDFDHLSAIFWLIPKQISVCHIFLKQLLILANSNCLSNFKINLFDLNCIQMSSHSNSIAFVSFCAFSNDLIFFMLHISYFNSQLCREDFYVSVFYFYLSLNVVFSFFFSWLQNPNKWNILLYQSTCCISLLGPFALSPRFNTLGSTQTANALAFLRRDRQVKSR